MEQKERFWKKRRNTKMFLAFLFAAILLASIAPIASADGWNYRRAINITNSGSVLTDYQVLVTLNTSNFNYSKANDDGSDLRFTNYANSTAYRYWLETWNTAGESKIWVNVSSVPDGDSKMYMWYNNTAASSESNGSATFEFFDDFEGSSVDTNKWDGVNNAVIVNGALDDNGDTIKAKESENWVNVSVEWKDKEVSYTATWPWMVTFFCMNSSDETIDHYRWVWSPKENWHYLRRYDNGSHTDLLSESGQPYNTGAWYHFKYIRMDDGTLKFYSDISGTLSLKYEGDQPNYITGYFKFYGHTTIEQRRDDIRVRKYADPEPMTSVSATEEDVTGPVEPVPELPTIILFSIGLLMLAGYVVIRRKNR